MCCLLCIHSSVDGHLGCFHFWAVVNNAAVNVYTQVFIWTKGSPLLRGCGVWEPSCTLTGTPTSAIFSVSWEASGGRLGLGSCPAPACCVCLTNGSRCYSLATFLHVLSLDYPKRVCLFFICQIAPQVFEDGCL